MVMNGVLSKRMVMLMPVGILGVVTWVSRVATLPGSTEALFSNLVCGMASNIRSSLVKLLPLSVRAILIMLLVSSRSAKNRGEEELLFGGQVSPLTELRLRLGLKLWLNGPRTVVLRFRGLMVPLLLLVASALLSLGQFPLDALLQRLFSDFLNTFANSLEGVLSRTVRVWKLVPQVYENQRTGHISHAKWIGDVWMECVFCHSRLILNGSRTQPIQGSAWGCGPSLS